MSKTYELPQAVTAGRRYSVSSAARILDVSRMTIARRISEGIQTRGERGIYPVQVDGGLSKPRYFIPGEVLIRYMEGKTI